METLVPHPLPIRACLWCPRQGREENRNTWKYVEQEHSEGKVDENTTGGERWWRQTECFFFFLIYECMWRRKEEQKETNKKYTTWRYSELDSGGRRMSAISVTWVDRCPRLSVWYLFCTRDCLKLQSFLFFFPWGMVFWERYLLSLHFFLLVRRRTKS